jgi:hypothetical protein
MSSVGPARDWRKPHYSYILKYLNVFRGPATSAFGRGGDDGLSMKDFHKDDRVSHARFGPGVVVAVDARYTIVEFDESGVRKFVTALVQLERCDLPTPVKPLLVRRRRARAPARS